MASPHNDFISGQDNLEFMLKNEKLFSAITNNIPSKEKLKHIIMALNEGANIDAVDSTNNGNTPLHVAATIGDVKIFKMLLYKGADIYIKNKDNHTVCDIIALQSTPKAKKLSDILHTIHGSRKRTGTSGIKGELFETKLLSLILFRSLCDEKILDFVLGTNLEGVGNFDDIILRYDMLQSQKSKILFIQTKHKDNQVLTVEKLLSSEGEFSVLKYLMSYLEIYYIIMTGSDNVLYKVSMRDIEYKFILYTSATFFTNKNSKKKILLQDYNEESVINTSKNGKIYKFCNDFDGLDILVESFTEARIIKLAKTLACFILGDNYKNMMLNHNINIYHHFLAQNVITILTKTEFQPLTTQPYNEGKFRSSFLTSDDHYLMLLRTVISEEISKSKNPQKNTENIMEILTFKLPVEFGNSNFMIKGDEAKQLRRLAHFNTIFQKLIENHLFKRTDLMLIKLDDESVGQNKLIQTTDLENHLLGGLVGNLLIHDDETDMLKINSNKASLSKHNLLILDQLSEKYETLLSQLRFDIDCFNFPKLTLYSPNDKIRDRKFVKGFLSKLRIHANQSREDEVELILKQEILNSLSCNKQKLHNTLLCARNDTIFLKLHDKIQKWWMQPNSALYLRKSCELYQLVTQEVLNYSLLNIINFISLLKITNCFLEFRDQWNGYPIIDNFLKSHIKIMIIISENTFFSSIKINKYLNRLGLHKGYLFLDLDHKIVEDSWTLLESELSITTASTIICISQCVHVENLNLKIKKISQIFNSKIILITNKPLNLEIEYYPEAIVYTDTENSFSNLSIESQKSVIEEGKILFQGKLTTVKSVLDVNSLSLLNGKLLQRIINNDNIILGKALTDKFYDKTIQNFIDRRVHRFITLDPNELNSDDVCFLTPDSNFSRITQKINDLILITTSENDFNDVCMKYHYLNIHWFFENVGQNHLIWQQTHGSLFSIIKHIKRGSNDDFTIELQTLKDISQKVVIISAESGMGKSTLLTHLAVNTRDLHPNLWIIKINLTDSVNQFNKWEVNETNIDIKEAILFLYSTIGFKYFESIGVDKESISMLLTVNNNNEIDLIEDAVNDFQESDLSEIKLFNFFYNNGNVAVVCDGFDEICPDYTNEVIKFLCVLKSSKISHLWIASRPYKVLDQLEFALGTFSYNLNPFTEPEQVFFLENAWLERLGTNKINPQFCFKFYNELTKYIEKDFMSVPFYLFMIAEVYQDSFRNYIGENTKLTREDFKRIFNTTTISSIYKKFITKKFDNQFKEKNPSLNLNDPYIRRLRDKDRQAYIDNHKKLAAYLILDKSIVFSEIDNAVVHEFIENVRAANEKIVMVQCDELRFTHYTFTEYFASEYIMDKMITDSCSSDFWQYFFNQILLNENKQGMRRFINSKLQDQCITAKLQSNIKHNNMTIIFDILFAQFSNSEATSVYIAIVEGFDFITLFLLKCIEMTANRHDLIRFLKLNHKKCDKYCITCAAVIINRQSVLRYLKELITNVGCIKPGNLIDSSETIICDTSDSSLRNEKCCLSLNVLAQGGLGTVDTVVKYLNKIIPLEDNWIFSKKGFLIALYWNNLLLSNNKKLTSTFGDLNLTKYNRSDLGAKFELLSKECEKEINCLENLTSMRLICMFFKTIFCQSDNCELGTDVKYFLYNVLPALYSKKILQISKVDFLSRELTHGLSHEKNLLSLILLRNWCEDRIKELNPQIKNSQIMCIIMSKETKRMGLAVAVELLEIKHDDESGNHLVLFIEVCFLDRENIQFSELDFLCVDLLKWAILKI